MNMMAYCKSALEAQRNSLVIIKELARVPTFLYGAGVYAEEVEKFLACHSIEVSGCFVDGEFGDSKPACSAPLVAYESIISTHSKFNIVVAFCGHPKKLLERVSKYVNSKVVAVKLIDCRFWERFSVLTATHFENNFSRYERVLSWLTDKKSKDTFLSYINAKLTYDGAGLQPLVASSQYFPEDLPEFSPSVDDVFVDGGAFTGDTLSVVLTKTSNRNCRKYYAFEPDGKNVKELNALKNQHHLDSVEVIQKGLWNVEEELRFASSGLRAPVCELRFASSMESRSEISESGDVVIQGDSIDRMGIDASFIKMDIEGAELNALQGAANVIRRLTPKLAIAIYHKPGDLLEIPELIKSLCSSYRFYLRLHSPMSEELILYAIKT